MKIKEEVKDMIKKNKACVNRLALTFDRTGRSIEKAIDRNADNGYLTTLPGLAVIRKHTNLTNKQILE
jgi:hypothetical protein